MKYSLEIVIDKPRPKVVELFKNSENLPKWQPGLINFIPISGEAGKPGAKSKLEYDMNGRKIEMIETITVNNLPDEFSGNYETKGVFNTYQNFFYEEGSDKTKWVTVSEFQFSGIMKLMGFFMKKSFPKETQKFMNRFKEFVENSD
jgi:uncharacterized membrane protein